MSHKDTSARSVRVQLCGVTRVGEDATCMSENDDMKLVSWL